MCGDRSDTRVGREREETARKVYLLQRARHHILREGRLLFVTPVGGLDDTLDGHRAAVAIERVQRDKELRGACVDRMGNNSQTRKTVRAGKNQGEVETVLSKKNGNIVKT